MQALFAGLAAMLIMLAIQAMTPWNPSVRWIVGLEITTFVVIFVAVKGISRGKQKITQTRMERYEETTS